MAHVQTPMSDDSKDETEKNVGGGQNGIDNRNGGGATAGVIGPSSFVFGQNMESRVLKRSAEEQLDKKTAEQEDNESEGGGGGKKEDPGEFPKATPAVMSQRPIIFAGSGKDAKGDKDDSKPSFKLNPPTLVHGKAKSAPKATDAEENTASLSKPLIRPSHLCRATQNWAALSAVATGLAFKLKAASSHPLASSFSKCQWNGKDGRQRNPEDGSVEVSSSSASAATASAPSCPTEGADHPATVAEGSAEASTNGKPKTNYFIKLSTNDTSRDTGFGVFGSFTDTKGNFGKKQNGATEENYFLQFAKVDSSSSKEATESPKALSNSSNSFVFGQKMDERVSSPPKKEGELQTAAQFAFGKNETSPEVSTKPSTSDSESPGALQDTACKSLVESACAYEKAKKSSEVTFQEVTNKTGEEDEENVFQTQCKLYVFDVERHVWQERGRGLLRLNDLVPSSSEQSSLQSRLVMRTQGSLRVVLNTKIWSGMTIEKPTLKNIRLSARDKESDSIRVFLIAASPKDAEQIYRAIEYRVQELKHAEREKDDGEAQEEEEEDCKDDGRKEKTSVEYPESVESDDSQSPSNSLGTDRSSPDPRIEGEPQTPPTD
ncbi:uncharacterized protein [Asterias amurensis]|uniref:uncharacterized protein isoform X1 n=1 Tax=Asterias amurensis TaxID=7602 RepID=UPI003AB11FB6